MYIALFEYVIKCMLDIIHLVSNTSLIYNLMSLSSVVSMSIDNEFDSHFMVLWIILN